MLCLPVFIILLLLASPAASNPLEKRIQNDLIRAALEDADMENDPRSIIDSVKTFCCSTFNLGICCSKK
uniref:Conotoxin Ar5.3 n=1 Tax=Conus arenatus TaxID=89451 RepID=CT53_CONAE|nr:RecName: Full=Conotoxin Ar5.3; AltName: Full=Conotoxin ArMLCL-0111; AltName: Full=Conotoxin ArMLCL-0212; AltName: Full=Conotoxin ArMLCL-D01; Flags: Precursor [Conus arenatus]AAG60420.1 conotoxin scaffold IX precursor [Conus arenatus]AAG60525.1 conotoxin scaffold IX precursor [Conus arenatus]